MKFNDVVAGIGTLNDLKRIASAHVVDHKNLNEQELRNAIVKVRPQYTDLDTVRNSLDIAFSRCPNHDHRILAALILEEILLNEEGYILQTTQTEERVMAIEQKLLNLSNETDISDLAAGKSPNRFRDYEIYDFVLRVAWDHQDSISPDEDNLLRKLRHKLRITELDHRIMESKLGKFEGQ